MIFNEQPGGDTEFRLTAASGPRQYDILLGLNRYFQSEHGFEVLTSDAKLFCVLGAKGSLSVKEAMLYSGLSYRGFYLVAARLAGRGSIVLEGDPHDGRVKRIRLAPGAKPIVVTLPEPANLPEMRAS